MNKPFEDWWDKIHSHCGPAPHPNEVFKTLKIGFKNAFNAGLEYEHSTYQSIRKSYGKFGTPDSAKR